jgi:lactate dehydrogenase-like 2-hydroxyacid dehydrogenase
MSTWRRPSAWAIAVVRVPAYSPEAVAEFTIGLMLALDRNIPRAWARVRDNNFALDGLIGRNLSGRTAGVVGTGRIGALVARCLRLGFGCEVLASDSGRRSRTDRRSACAMRRSTNCCARST